MITKRNTLICDICGLFCKYYDEWTPFGCADPENPEPYDPSHICKKCFKSVKADWKERLQKNHRIGDYQKSRAEMEAAEELGLVWVGSSGVGTLGTKDFSDHYYYLPKGEIIGNIFERLTPLEKKLKKAAEKQDENIRKVLIEGTHNEQRSKKHFK